MLTGNLGMPRPLMPSWAAQSQESWSAPASLKGLSHPDSFSKLILDLAAEAAPIWKETASFYGHDWLWCFVSLLE